MRLPQFTIRDLLWLTVLVAMGLVWFFQKPNQPGRYQLGTDHSHALINDTATGRCWMLGDNGRWGDTASPVGR
jgi:hypothetical protein